MSAEMLSDPNKVLPASELRRLTQGSYEQRIAEATEAVYAYFEGKSPTLVAAYEDTAVVCVEDTFFKVGMQKSDLGNLKVTGSEPLKVDLRDKDRMDDYVEAEALGIVDLWIAGSEKKAKAKLRDLVPQVTGVPETDENKIVDKVESVLGGDSAWKAAWSEREAPIRSFLGSDLSEDRLRPKFRKLYDGTIEEGKLDDFTSLVAEDLKTVINRYEQLEQEAREAFHGSYAALVEAQTSEEDESGVLDMYEGFTSDLLVDFDRVTKQTQIGLNRVHDVRCQGRLRDVLAEGIAPYEGASRFVVKVANLITKAQEE